jgi:hypothetical protein
MLSAVEKMTPAISAWILRCLDDQFSGRDISLSDHKQLIKMVDAGLLGMDGFKYCTPENAKDCWRRCQEGALQRAVEERKRKNKK